MATFFAFLIVAVLVLLGGLFIVGPFPRIVGNVATWAYRLVTGKP